MSSNGKAPYLTPERERELLFFAQQNNLSFTDLRLLDNAFTHSSYANESKGSGVRDNERLEFLGDSILSLSVSDYIYSNSKGDEGDYTRIRSAAVSEEALAEVAESIQLYKYLLIGKGEEMTGGRHKKAILADCMEAVFAAVYLDCGLEEARSFILRLLIPHINSGHRDYKTLLQEHVQKRWKTVPVYTTVKTEGPEHMQVFWVSVNVHGREYGPEKGRNKKDAEQNAASLACRCLGLTQ